MTTLEQINFVIPKVESDEAWLLGERRECPISRDDPELKEIVCSVVLRCGATWRQIPLETFLKNSENNS